MANGTVKGPRMPYINVRVTFCAYFPAPAGTRHTSRAQTGHGVPFKFPGERFVGGPYKHRVRAGVQHTGSECTVHGATFFLVRQHRIRFEHETRCTCCCQFPN